jgi:hypothetical protein
MLGTNEDGGRLGQKNPIHGEGLERFGHYKLVDFSGLLNNNMDIL